MAIAWADVEVVAPELSSLAANLQTEILATVNERLTLTNWVSAQRLKNGQVYLAAHIATYLTSTSTGAGVFPLEMERVGELERQYAVDVSAGLTDLNGTKYGQLYQAELRTLPSSMGWVVTA